MKSVKAIIRLFSVFVIAVILTTTSGCSQSKISTQEVDKNMEVSLEEIKVLKSEINYLTEEKNKLMSELDSIGVPEKIKYVNGYQGNMKVIEKTTFKLMPTSASKILATLEPGTIVEVLAEGEVTTFVPC